MSTEFYELLHHYGVPKRVVKALRKHRRDYPLPEPYSVSQKELPRELPGPLVEMLNAPGSIYLYGAVGSGKSTFASYLMALFLRQRRCLGSANYLLKQLSEGGTHVKGTRGPYYRYVRVSDLLARMKADFDKAGHHEGQDLFAQCLEAQILVLDDLTDPPSAWELIQLDRLVDWRYAEMLPTIFTSNYAPHKLSKMIGSDRIASRVEEMCTIERMDDRLR